MNPLENELDYPWGDTLPEVGRAHNVAIDVRWIRMPLPFALDHINLWLLRDRIDGREGWTVVDCGIDRTEVRDCWETVSCSPRRRPRRASLSRVRSRGA